MRGVVQAAAVTVLALALGACAEKKIDPESPVGAVGHLGAVKVACVGDSITFGSGTTEGNDYPSQLQRMLGERYAVRNFGLGGTTLLNAGDKPYQQTTQLKDALAWEPDVVVIMLGTNDSKPQNWVHKGDFEKDYRELVGKFEKLASKPRVWLMYPPPVIGAGAWGIREAPVEVEEPMIRDVAKAMHCGVIDIHWAMRDKPELLPDNVHPNAAGAEVIARTVHAAIMGKQYEGGTTVKEPGANAKWN